jgi:hypothetical protein
MRDCCEEASLLDARPSTPFRVLITCNGGPSINPSKRAIANQPPALRQTGTPGSAACAVPVKLRYDSCRLVDLENRVLGCEREGDVPGALIPYLCFEYLLRPRGRCCRYFITMP